MSGVADEIINRLMAVFGEPKSSNPELFLAEFARAMDGYDPDALRKAADNLINNAKYWPRPAELLDEARRVLGERQKHRPPETFAPRQDPTPEEIAGVKAMLVDFHKFMAANVTVSERPDDTNWKRGQRDQFEAMQKASPNQGMHRTRAGMMDLAKRITGDRDD